METLGILANWFLAGVQALVWVNLVVIFVGAVVVDVWAILKLRAKRKK